MAELWPWLKLQWQLKSAMLVGIVLLLMTLAAGVGLLSLSGWFITATGLTALQWAAGHRVPFDVYIPGGGIRFFALTRTVARYLERLYNHNTVLRLLSVLRLRLFDRLAMRRPDARQALGGADSLGRLTADVDALDNLYLRLAAPTVVALIATLVITALLWWHSPMLAVSAGMILLTTLVAITWGLAQLTYRDAFARVGRLSRIREHLFTQLEGLAELTAARRHQHYQRDLLARSLAFSATQFRVDRSIAWGQAAAQWGGQLAVLVVFIGGLWLFQQQLMSAPVVVMLSLGLLALGEAYMPLSNAFGYWGNTVAAAQRLNALADNAATPASATAVTRNDHVLTPPQPLVWDGLYYGHDLTSVDTTLTTPCVDSDRLAPGEWLGLTAPSGWGKSTLADRLIGLSVLRGGTLQYGQQAATADNWDQWHRYFSYLPQRPHVFQHTVRHNLTLGCDNINDDQLWRVLTRCALADRVEQLPRGLDTPLGAGGIRLSGGEQQRLCLARTVLRQAPIIIMDEPFSGLDKATAAAIAQNLRSALSGRSVIVLAHHASAMPAMDRYRALNAP